MEGLFIFLKGGLLIVVPVILSQTPKEKRMIRGILWITFFLLVFSNIYINYKTDSANKQILDDNKELLQVVKDPNFAKNPEESAKLEKMRKEILASNAPKKALLRFSFHPFDKQEKLVDKRTVVNNNGIVEVTFTIKNIGTEPAKNGTIWLSICEGCSFAEEPKYFEIMKSHDEDHSRRMHFDLINTGASLDPLTVKLFHPFGYDSFEINLRYACETCFPPTRNDPHSQILTVNVLKAQE